MTRILQNIAAFVAGWLGGSAINIGLVQLGHTLLPIEGLDPNDMEAFAAAMPSLGAEHFLFPFLAHALGTLVGAIIAAWIAASHKMAFAFAVGILFLIGGVMINILLPGPLWFTITDLVLAYIPMAWIGWKAGVKLSRNTGE